MCPFDNAPDLGQAFIHPIVESDSRIPRDIKCLLGGEHPGIFLQRARIAAGFTDPQAFVDRVNEVLEQSRVHFRLSLKDLASYEAGTHRIRGPHLEYLCIAAKSDPASIIYGGKVPMRQPEAEAT